MTEEKKSFIGSIKSKAVKSIGETTRAINEQVSKIDQKKKQTANPVEMVENRWNDFIMKIWVFIGYVFLTLIILQLKASSAFMAVLGVLMLIGIPVVAIVLLISLIPTVKVGKYTLFSRRSFSTRKQLQHSAKVGKFFFQRLYEISPEIVLILGAVGIMLVLSLIISLTQ